MSIIWLVACNPWCQRGHPDRCGGQGQGSDADDAGQELAVGPQIHGVTGAGQDLFGDA